MFDVKSHFWKESADFPFHCHNVNLRRLKWKGGEQDLISKCLFRFLGDNAAGQIGDLPAISVGRPLIEKLEPQKFSKVWGKMKQANRTSTRHQQNQFDQWTKVRWPFRLTATIYFCCHFSKTSVPFQSRTLPG